MSVHLLTILGKKHNTIHIHMNQVSEVQKSKKKHKSLNIKLAINRQVAQFKVVTIEEDKLKIEQKFKDLNIMIRN